EIERFVVGTVPEVMPEVALTYEVERRREEEGERDAGRDVRPSIRMEDVVLSLGEQRVDGVHDDAVRRRQEQRAPEDARLRGRVQGGGEGQHLEASDRHVDRAGDGVWAGAHDAVASRAR